MLVLFNPSGHLAVKCSKAARPKFSSHRGRTWDHFPITIDGQDLDVHLDTTWGVYGYFQWQGQWYMMPQTTVDIVYLPESRRQFFTERDRTP